MNYIFLFLFGGSVLSFSYYLANTLNNPGLAVLFSLFPMSILNAFFIKKKSNLVKYTRATIFVIIAGLIPWILYYLYVNNYSFNKYISLLMLAVGWVVFELCCMKFIK